MTASLAGLLPRIKSLFALPVLGLIYVTGKGGTHIVSMMLTYSECMLFGRCMVRAAAMRNRFRSTKSGYVSISFMKMNGNSMGRFAS